MSDTCRVCLCSDRRMHAISNTVFVEVWEKLTNAEFNNNDGKPLLVCYICCAQLRKSFQLMKRAQQAEELLTSVINIGSEISQKSILLVVSQTHDLDYNYGIGEVYQLECPQFDECTVEGIKKEYEDKNDINIKEEEGDQEENVDTADAYPETPFNYDIPMKKIQKREVRIILKKINTGAQTRKRIKPDETIEDIKPKDAWKRESNNECKASNTISKNNSMDPNMKISKRTIIVESVDNCYQVNNISPKVSMLLKHKNRAKNMSVKTNKRLVSKVGYNNADKDIFEKFLHNSADAVTPSTSLDRCDGEIKSVYSRTRPENDFSCHSCQYKCLTESELNTHQCKYTEEISCDFCAYTTSRPHHLTSHMKYKHSKEKNFSCHICPYRFVNKGDLNKHVRTHTGEKPYVCHLCAYRCSKRYSLTSHIKFRHTKEKNFSCDICQYRCVTKSGLNVHIRKHTGEKPYICHLCHTRYSQKNRLKEHVKYKHAKEMMSDLNKHLRIRSGEKPYICDLCDLKFARKVEIKRHIRHKHAEEKNFSCPICQYKSIRKYKVKEHIRVHTREKPYICDLCGSKFAWKTGLNMHVKNKHTKEKNYSCHICQYKCVTNFKLNLHLRKHTGEKPYKCDFCDHRSAQRTNLIVHIKNKHAKVNIISYLAKVSQKAP